MNKFLRKISPGFRPANFSSFLRSGYSPAGINTFIKIVLAAFLLYAGVQNANATRITFTSLTPPNTTGPLYMGQTGIVIYGLNATTNNNAGTTAVTSLTFTGTQTINNLFSSANISLYYTTSPTLTGGFNLNATVGASGTSLTFTGFSQTIGVNATGYFYVVVNFDGTAGTVPGTFELDMSNYLDNSTNTTVGTVTGTPYSLVGSIATLTSLTTTVANNGLSATPVPDGSTNYSVYGFSLTGVGTGTGTINSLEFFDGGGSASKDNSYYTTAYLYSSASNTYVPGTTNVPANLVSTATSDNTRFINFTGTNISVTGSTNLYYFIVLSNTLVNTTTSLFALNYVTGTVTNTSISTGASVTGPAYTFAGPPSFGTATTSGLAAATALNYTQAQAGILGFSITTTAATTVNSITFNIAMSAGMMSSYFSNVTLYSNSVNSLTGATRFRGQP